MSIIQVYDDFEGWSGDVAINPQTLRPEGTFDRAMCVEFSADDASFKPITALYAAGVPRPWDPIGPDYPFTYCVGYSSIKMDGPKIVRIVVRYKIWEDPLAIPPKKRWYFNTASDVLHAGCVPGHPSLIQPIVNSAGEAPDPPMMTDYDDLVLQYSVNRATYDPQLASRYMKAVNLDTFFGFPAGKVRCKLFTGDEARAGGLLYFEHNYEFHIRTFESDPLNVGWLRRFRDEGFHEMVLNEQNHLVPRALGEYLIEYAEDTGLEVKRTFKPVSKAVALDGAGRVLAAGKPDHFIKVQDFDQLPFSVLGLE
jgi:hypothetical protein